MRSSIIVVFILILLQLHNLESALFNFKRYSYRKKSGNDRRFRLVEENCQNQQKCLEHVGLPREKCVRMCISSSCYEEIYAWNELEEGEIDVRLTSFKGCAVQQIRQKEIEDQRFGL